MNGNLWSIGFIYENLKDYGSCFKIESEKYRFDNFITIF